MQNLWAEGAPDLWVNANIGSAAAQAVSFVCPMDRDVTSKTPGVARAADEIDAGIPDRKNIRSA